MDNTPRCHNPSCQKPLSMYWGVADGYRVRTGQVYCSEWCASDDEQRIYVEAHKSVKRPEAKPKTFADFLLRPP
jgi:hypothetical protein